MTLAQEYPIRLLCALLDFPRSSFYYHGHGADESELEKALLHLAEECSRLDRGYRRLTAQLRREDWEVNGKRVRRLMRCLGLQRPQAKRKRRTTDSDHAFPRYPNLVQDLLVTHPDQVWVADITYVHLRQEDVYLAVLMDVYTRCIRGWHLGRNLDTELTLTALQHALQTHGPEMHHSDQGVQYASTAYTLLLQQVGTQISMAAVGEPTQNGSLSNLV